jgi:hypothetical protein
MDNRALADPVAIVSIVSGATVAIAVPFIGATLERRRLRWQTEMARMDELRTLLDTASVHMYEAWTVLYEIEQEFGQESGGRVVPEERSRALAESLTAKFDEVMRDELRIQVRLPDGALVTEKHRAMRSLLQTAEYNFRHYVESGGPNAGQPPDLPSTSLGGDAIGDFMSEVRRVIGATSEARSQEPNG